MNKNGVIYTVIFTFLTAFFFVFFLALASGATAEKVEINRKLAVQKAVLSALDVLPEDPSHIAGEYDKRFDSIPDPGDLMPVSLDGKSILVNYYSGSGLWGTITGILAVDENLERIIGLEIISHNETPGLGGRIDETWFKRQFRNEKISDQGILVRKGSGSEDSDPDNAAVDGITGASLTSSAVQTIINTQLDLVREGGKN